MENYLTSFAKLKCGGKGIRTPDLLIANETLYQLSYTPEIFRRPPLKVPNLSCISNGGPPSIAGSGDPQELNDLVAMSVDGPIQRCPSATIPQC